MRVWQAHAVARQDSLEKQNNKYKEALANAKKSLDSYQYANMLADEVIELSNIENAALKSTNKNLNKKIKGLRVKSAVIEVAFIAGAGYYIYHNLK
jgi:hypothetical protein